ncbi:MAG: cytochrome P450, partial [Burkholderiaceae bacterium]|nr:cytochrome P450 [Burkholderiaceae bacterium]
ALPVSVVASLLGFPDAQLPQVAAWMGDFVACLSPLSSAQQIGQAHVAAQALLQRLAELVRQAQEGAQRDSLIARVAAEAQAVGWNDSAALLANLAGLLSQTYEATAGLIGNSIVALVRQPEEERSEPDDADTLVHTVQRCDPPVQNTRRFVARDCVVEGVALKAGDVVLLVLAAAGRDPDADGHAFGFGAGRHACPGEVLATTIATSALQMLMAGPLSSPESLQALRWTYRRSLNARIPVFTRA